ncbi:MAG: putative transport system permease protein [Solirubrobacteraceae bacterium]|nr:putative transport system permease protein [Solirubrobacteraceae bacterium]
MIGVALKGLMARKLRAVLTAIAIVLGVSMVSGTYVLTDTIKAAFTTVFTRVYENTDAVITGKSAIGEEHGGNERSTPPSLPASLLAKVRALPGVAQASGAIADNAQLIGHDGKVIARGGAPALAFSYQPGAQRFNPLSLAGGNWPERPEQVDIDAATASKDGFSVGQRIGVIARGPVQYFTIAGTVRFGGVSSLGGATMAVFTTSAAQQIFNKRGRYDSIQVAAAHGVSPRALVREIAPLLPASAQVRTAQAQAQKQTSDTNAFLDIFKEFLLAFGGIALFVGSFVIANTLSITITQRTRELATLRTLGATRRQVLLSVLTEALVIAVLASVVGLFLGLLLAKALNSLLVSFGIDLPHTSTVFATRTVLVSLLVGVLITLVAALRPAMRSTRVPPIAAVREGAVLAPTRLSRLGAYPALVTLACALALMLLGLLLSDASTGARLIAIGGGALAMFLGVAMLAPRVIPRLALVLGWPLARAAGASGSLARGNSIRNPVRTASTAAALMIGLALVTFVGVLAAGLRTRFESSVNETFIANYALTASDNFSPIGIASASALGKVPGVAEISGVRAGDGRAFGSRVMVSGVDPAISRLIAIKWQAGGPQTPGELGSDGAFVPKDYASEHHLRIGSTLALETPTGALLRVRVRGITAPPRGTSPYGEVTLSRTRFDQLYANPKNVFTFINMRGGVTAANTRRLQAALAAFPDAKVQTKAQFKENQLQGLNLLLNLLYVLLSLSIVVSLLGIVNTLVLTVFERTREIGMLRALGMTRRQVRRMVRYESVITALLGAAFGIPLGIVLALLTGIAIKYAAFTLPIGTLVSFVIVSILAGVVAAIIPARRAARLNVLEALQYE